MRSRSHALKNASPVAPHNFTVFTQKEYTGIENAFLPKAKMYSLGTKTILKLCGIYSIPNNTGFFNHSFIFLDLFSAKNRQSRKPLSASCFWFYLPFIVFLRGRRVRRGGRFRRSFPRESGGNGGTYSRQTHSLRFPSTERYCGKRR